MAGEIDTSNKFNVRRADASVAIGFFSGFDTRPFSVDDALNLAAWLVLVADPDGEHFKTVLGAIQSEAD